MISRQNQLDQEVESTGCKRDFERHKNSELRQIFKGIKKDV